MLRDVYLLNPVNFFKHLNAPGFNIYRQWTLHILLTFITEGFINSQAPGKLSGCEDDFTACFTI